MTAAPRRAARRWNLVTWHRRVAIWSGLVLLAWLVSGAMILLPRPVPDALVRPVPRVEYGDHHALSPAAVVALVAAGDSAPRVHELQLRALAGRLVYEVRTTHAGTRLFDASDGSEVHIAEDLVVQLARLRVDSALPVAMVERLEAHSVRYLRGPLPVYRVDFADGRGTTAFVDPVVGSVSYIDNAGRLRAAIVGLHDFGPLLALLSRSTVRTILMTFTIASLVVVATGYWLWWRTRRRVGEKRTTG